MPKGDHPLHVQVDVLALLSIPAEGKPHGIRATDWNTLRVINFLKGDTQTHTQHVYIITNYVICNEEDWSKRAQVIGARVALHYKSNRLTMVYGLEQPTRFLGYNDT